MIKLTPVPKPKKLTRKLQRELTNIYKQQKESVWKKPYINLNKDLLRISPNCCYCQCKLDEESKYIEVEHYHPKSIYPDEVMEWDNLLPSCKRCNMNKGSHDTKVLPLIKPTVDNPKDHLFFQEYRLEGKTEIGRHTKKEIGLNDTQRLVIPRCKIGEQTKNVLNELYEKMLQYFNGTRKKVSLIIQGFKNILLEATPEYEYNTTVATILLNEKMYKELKCYFIWMGLWDTELIALEEQAEHCRLDKR